MTDATDPSDADVAPAKKGGKKGLLFGLLGALLLGGGGFYVTYSGMIGGGGADKAAEGGHESGGEAAPAENLAFIPLEPITISLPPGASAKHLRFSGQLEVDPAQSANVTLLMPRILDVLNTYLRAVEIRDLEQPSSIPRLRAQMLRRVQVVTGEGQVRDLLITEFILN